MRFKKLTGVVLICIACLLAQCTNVEKAAQDNTLSIIPKPSVVEKGSGSFTIDANTVIAISSDEITGAANYLADILAEASSFSPKIKELSNREEHETIILQLTKGDSKEAYSLTVTADQIRISASDVSGIFYGIQTLRQLLPPAIEVKNKESKSWSVPVVSIEDKPQFAWRGMHLDVSRHFFSVEFVKTFIDRLALYKLNKLHLHLTDDQGWRLEIKKYPQLTEQGAWRTLNNQDSACIKRATTNSDFALPTEFFKEKDGQKVYGGYYSQDDIKEIVAYASKRFVTIVPEIDMPGHMNAAIPSFPDLTCVDAGGWGKLFTIPLCPCEETTYTFISNVLGEVAPLFPGDYIHIGADEVDESSWLKSNSCKKLLKEKNWKSSKELHSYFVNRVNKIVNDLGKKTIGWDEITDGHVDSTITVMYWRGWVSKAPALATSRHHDVIMSPTSHCYFDYEQDDKTLESMYSFNPVPADVAVGDRQRIIGLQANIWTEYIPTPARLDYMTMPRMTALAETGWSGTSDKNWGDYSSRVAQHYSRWDELGIKYRLPDIQGLKKHIAFTNSTTLDLQIPNGVSEIRYTVDGTEPDASASSRVYNQALTIDSTVTIKLLTYGFKGRAGNRYTLHFKKEDYLKPASVNSAELRNGLSCKYFEGEYSSVTKILSKDLKKEAIVDTVSIPTFCRENVFALEFDGLIDIAADGIYTFYLSSDDGSTLQIGDRQVINYDGYHGGNEMDGQVALSKGLHSFGIKYFDGGGGRSLTLMYEGPGIEKQHVPDSAFKIQKTK